MATTQHEGGTSSTGIIWMSVIAVLLCVLFPGGSVAGLLLAGLALVLTRLSPALRPQFGLWIAPTLALAVCISVTIAAVIFLT